MINLIKKIALTDGSQTVILSNLIEGVDGTATFGLTNEQNEIKIEDAQTRIITESYTFDIRVLRNGSPDSVILSNWVEEQTPLILTGLGIDGVILWELPSILNRNDDFGGRLVSEQIKLTAEIPLGYTDGQKLIYAGANLLGNSNILGRGGQNYAILTYELSEAGYNVAFDNGAQFDAIGDSGAVDSVGMYCLCNAGKEGLLQYFTDMPFAYNGWTLDNGIGAGVSGQNLVLTYKGANANIYSPYIFFPYVGQVLRGSIRLIETNGYININDGVNFLVDFYNQTKNFISSSNLRMTNVNGVSVPRQLTFSGVSVPSETVYIRFKIKLLDTEFANGDRVVFTAPILTNKQANTFEL